MSATAERSRAAWAEIWSRPPEFHAIILLRERPNHGVEQLAPEGGDRSFFATYDASIAPLLTRGYVRVPGRIEPTRHGVRTGVWIEYWLCEPSCGDAVAELRQLPGEYVQLFMRAPAGAGALIEEFETYEAARDSLFADEFVLAAGRIALT